MCLQGVFTLWPSCVQTLGPVPASPHMAFCPPPAPGGHPQSPVLSQAPFAPISGLGNTFPQSAVTLFEAPHPSPATD